MDRSLTLLLLAIALTWLAWRAARRQTERAVLLRALEQERSSCTLEAVESARGRGFVVVAGDGSRSDGAGLRWDEHGVEIVDVAPQHASPDADTATAFNAGSGVELIPADDGRALQVWDPGMTVCAGIVDPLRASALLQRADADEIGECLVVWEHLDGRRRTGIRLLVVHADMLLDQS
jgi:hypothetical protein